MNQSKALMGTSLVGRSVRPMQLVFIFFCFLGTLSAQSSLSSEIMQIQDSNVSLDVLRTALSEYNSNPQNFTLPFTYNEEIINAIVKDEEITENSGLSPYIREYFTTPDESERQIYEEVLLLAIEEKN